MPSRSNPCDKTRLHLSLEERLSEAQQSELENHLESCPACRQELEQMAAASKLWGDAQLLRGEPIPIQGNSLANGVGAPGVVGLGSDEEDAEVEAGWLAFLDAPDPDCPQSLGRLGPYEVVEFLGRGGMGLVLKARDPSLDRMVAIKVLTPALAHGATARRRFAREARAVAAVGNEHIVAIHAVDEFRGLPYLVMQYVAGRSLQERLDRSGPLEVKEILRIGTQAARALEAAHAQGVVHRDIKPANILLENCIERVKLTDFGLARAIDDASLTQSGVIAGTPQYMAPEQARGEPIAAAADLFSLGAVLYAMAAGRPPFRASSTLAVLKRVCEVRHQPVRELNPDVPDWLEAVIDRLLAKDPADRFESAREVAELLERGLAHVQQPASVRPPLARSINPQPTQDLDFDPPASKPSRSLPRRPFALVAALLLLFGAGLGASEAAGWTQVADYLATVLRIKTPEGTLVIKCADPSVHVELDGKDVVIGGSGLEEIRLRTGVHRLAVIKDGHSVREEFVSVSRGGKEIVNVALEPSGAAGVAETRNRGDLVAPTSHATQCAACHVNAPAMAVDQPLRVCHPWLDDWLATRHPRRMTIVGAKPHPARGRGLVWSLAYALDGRHLVIGQQGIDGRNSTLHVRDLARRCDVAWFHRSASAGYRSVALSPDGRTLAAGSLDGCLARINTDGWVFHQDENNGSPINAVAFLPKSAVIAVGGWDGQVKFYHPFSKIDSQIEYPGRIYSIAVSPDGSTIAIGGRAAAVQVYDMSLFRLRATLKGHAPAVESLDFSPDGKLLASAGGSKVMVWDTVDWKVAAPPIKLATEALCVRFSPNGKLLAFSSGDSALRHDKVVATWVAFLTVPGWRVVRTLQAHTNSIYALAFSPDGTTLASGSLDQTVKLWDVESGELQDTIVPGESDTSAQESLQQPSRQNRR